MRALVCLALVPLMGLAGCVDAPVGASAAELATPDEAPQAGLVELRWSGAYVVGLGMEIPGHTHELGDATGTLWSSSFHLLIHEPPASLEIQLDWSAAASDIQIMASPPEEDGHPPVVYATPFATRGPLCFAIPPDAIVPGAWPVMSHSRVSTPTALEFTIRAVGGAVEIEDRPHRVAAGGIPASILHQEDPEPAPCAGA